MKTNKILVCVSANPSERLAMLEQLAIQCGFALIRSDARKLVAHSINDINIPTAYFVISDNYDFRDSASTNQRLFEMAARGIAVIVGVKKLASVYEPFCTVHYPEHIL